MKKLLFLLPGIAFAAEPALLDRPISSLRLENAPIQVALRALSRNCQTRIIVEPDVAGDVSVELADTTLRHALAAMVEPAGFCFEESGGNVYVKRFQTILYPIDYPQLTRSGSGSASITLGGSTSNQAIGTNAIGGMPLANGLNGGSDATQISVSQENQNTFWANFENELRSMLKEGETLILNRFSGVAQITAPVRRQAIIGAFITLINQRITCQVEIEARMVEVTLRDESKLGVDWEQAAATLGGLKFEGISSLDITGLGGGVLSPNTLVARLTNGQASAVIHALQQQGEVRTVSQPRLRALNNQTAFIKVGRDQPFFRLQQSTTINQPGTTTPFNQTQNTYSVSTITIGTILAVTPQIGSDRVITLDVLPAITRLQSIVTSPDGQQTAPVTEVKQASTIVRLRDGETAVIGGLIADDEGTTDRSVPFLSSVPVLGRAFRSQSTLKSRTELIIFLTPRLV